MAFVVKHQQATPVASVKDGTYRATVSAIRHFISSYWHYSNPKNLTPLADGIPKSFDFGTLVTFS